MTTGQPWSRAEVESIVDDYFDMLGMELSGRRYAKSQHRAALVERLPGRSEGSIEFKHCNISAVLSESGRPIIDGYKPRTNIQELLRIVVDEKWPDFNESKSEVFPSALGRGEWRTDVVSCIDRLGTVFLLDDVYRFEEILSSFHPENRNVRAIIRRSLQELRDLGVIVFVDNRGRYRKTPGFPAGVEIVDIDAGESSDPFEMNDDVPNDPAERYLRAIRSRRGAPSFRRKLMRLYDGKCAVTGDGPAEVLEAAHIEPHAVSGRNSISNGLLLRADVHTLFDLDLLRINPETFGVEIADKLRSTTYKLLQGTSLRPRVGGGTPSRKLLRDRYLKLKDQAQPRLF